MIDSPALISMTDVTKVFSIGLWRKKIAVNSLNVTIPKGETIGLLGPNGSGKSTTLKLILGFLYPTHGEIRVGPYAASDRRSRLMIGYLPENPRFQKFLSADAILHYFGSLLALSGKELARRTDELIELVGLKDARKERVQGFSKGMTQRLAIAQALLNNPEILLLDEPMSGLDPLGRREVRQLILAIREQFPGTTIFFSSHILADVEELCSSVLVLRLGKLIAQKSVSELIRPFAENFEIVVSVNEEGIKQLIKRPGVRARGVPGGISIEVDGAQNLTAELEQLRKFGANVVRIQSQRHNLERVLFAGQGLTLTEDGA